MCIQFDQCLVGLYYSGTDCFQANGWWNRAAYGGCKKEELALIVGLLLASFIIWVRKGPAIETNSW